MRLKCVLTWADTWFWFLTEAFMEPRSQILAFLESYLDYKTAVEVSTYWMLSFLASFILHLLWNEVLWNSQADLQTPQWNTGVPGKEWQKSVRVRALFMIHWFMNAAEMQQHSLEVEDQIITPAVLSLPKRGVAFTSPGFLLVLNTTPSLHRLWHLSNSLLDFIPQADPILPYPTLSYPIHFACWVSFPLLWLAGRAQVQEEPEAGVCGEGGTDVSRWQSWAFPFWAAVTSGISSPCNM